MDLIEYSKSIKPKRKRNPNNKPKDSSAISEAQEGKLLCTWFSRRYFRYQNQLIHIPNGAHLHGDPRQRAMQMNSLKAQGLIVGASDYFLAVPMGSFHGCWIELKKSTIKKASDNQIIFLRRQKMFGFEAFVASGFEEAKEMVDEYLSL